MNYHKLINNSFEEADKLDAQLAADKITKEDYEEKMKIIVDKLKEFEAANKMV